MRGCKGMFESMEGCKRQLETVDCHPNGIFLYVNNLADHSRQTRMCTGKESLAFVFGCEDAGPPGMGLRENDING